MNLLNHNCPDCGQHQLSGHEPSCPRGRPNPRKNAMQEKKTPILYTSPNIHDVGLLIQYERKLEERLKAMGLEGEVIQPADAQPWEWDGTCVRKAGAPTNVPYPGAPNHKGMRPKDDAEAFREFGKQALHFAEAVMRIAEHRVHERKQMNDTFAKAIEFLTPKAEPAEKIADPFARPAPRNLKHGEGY